MTTENATEWTVLPSPFPAFAFHNVGENEEPRRIQYWVFAFRTIGTGQFTKTEWMTQFGVHDTTHGLTPETSWLESQYRRTV